VDLRDPRIGLFRLGLLADGGTFSFVFIFVLAAGESGIVLNLCFFSPMAEPGLAVLDVGFALVVEFIGLVLLFDTGAVLDAVVARVVVGLWAFVWLFVGLVAPALKVDVLVAVDVRRISVGAAGLELVLRSSDEGAMDLVFGFAAMLLRLDSSSVVFSSPAPTGCCTRLLDTVGVSVDEVGLRAVAANVGLAGGLLRLEVAVLVADDAVGFDSRSVRLVVGRVLDVEDFEAGFFTVLVVPARLTLLEGSSPVAACLRDDGLSILDYSVHNTLQRRQIDNIEELDSPKHGYGAEKSTRIKHRA